MAPFFEEQVEKLEHAFNIQKRIPRLKDLNDFLMAETGFRIKPVPGIIDQRQFLNTLGHRVFCCTQYIRHPATRDYTEEPDILHEIVGHIAMLSNKNIADLTHQIGLMSMALGDKQVAELGSIYWFTIEFGAVRHENGFRSYGAALAGSVA